ncbi:MAG: hypothetical protein HRT68_08440 [Flavobacteriaceae bacterium]|nr:hypothetical protein [Flavobacteriaceae bacterium]
MKAKLTKAFKKLKTPNGWGRQEYEGQSLKLERDQRRDKSRPNALEKMAFVQRIMIKYVTGYPKRSI